MKRARSIIGTALILLAISALTNIASQDRQTTQKKSTAAAQAYLPPLRISTPITFEEFPELRTGQSLIARVNEQYEPGLGILFNDVEVSIYPEGLVHGTRAITRCAGVEFGCDPQFVMKFPKKPQRRIKIWFGYTEHVSRADRVVLKAFNSTGTPIGEASEELAVSDAPVSISKNLEVTSENNDIATVTVRFQANANNFAGLVLDDVDFDDLLPQPDLTIETLDAQLALDRQLIITAGIKNIGKGVSIPTILELSEPRFWETPPIIAVPALKPGEPFSLSLVTQLPEERERRAYPYLLVIDPKQTIRDSDTTNNSKPGRFALARGKPDLTVRIVNTGVDSSQHAFVFAEITNIGTAASAPTVVQVESGGQTIGTAAVEPVQPNDSVQVNVLIPQKPRPGRHDFQAVVNPDKSFDEADLTNNSVPGVLAIPTNWWCRPEVLFPIGICVLVIGLWLGYKLIRKRPRVPGKPELVQPGEREPTKPHPSVPTFAARPTIDAGTQEIMLDSAETPAVAFKVRPQIGIGTTDIFDGINDPP